MERNKCEECKRRHCKAANNKKEKDAGRDRQPEGRSCGFGGHTTALLGEERSIVRLEESTLCKKKYHQGGPRDDDDIPCETSSIFTEMFYCITKTEPRQCCPG